MEPKKALKTFQFHNTVVLQTAKRGVMRLPQHAEVAIGSPPEFRGTPDVWCPEELLLGSVNSCLMLTFVGLSQRRGLNVAAIDSQVDGTVESVDGHYEVTRITVKPVITLGPQGDPALAAELFKAARQACILSNSVKATIDLAPEFRTGGARALA